MKVLFVTQYGILAASSRTRVFHYLPYLASRGICYRVLTVLPDQGLAGSQLAVTRQVWRKLFYYFWASWRTLLCGLQGWWQAKDCDLLFVQKVIWPMPLRWLFRWQRPLAVYDFDDAIFTTEVRRQNWLAAWKQRRNAAGLPAMLRLAELAIVENEYTARFAAAHCPRTAIITGPIDTRRYCPDHRPAERAVVVLGWIGSASTLPYLELIRKPLERLGRRFPQARLHVVGAEQVQVEGIPVQAKPWSLEKEVEELRAFDIGLMPVPDDPWTRGKGGYKLLQYMAMGLPVVASPVGINRQIVTPGQEGFWAETEEEWEGCLARLIADPGLRRRMGALGRCKVEAEYALEKAGHRLVDLLEDLVRQRVQ
jgi:glycosyltransferase involved in cell wall biosynthesis